MVASCAAPVKEPERTAFWSDYSKLEIVENNNLRFVSERAKEFDSFLIDPIQILFERDSENPVFSDREIEDLKQHVVDSLTKQLTKDDVTRWCRNQDRA